jgi:hypothetical protein
VVQYGLILGILLLCYLEDKIPKNILVVLSLRLCQFPKQVNSLEHMLPVINKNLVLELWC